MSTPTLIQQLDDERAACLAHAGAAVVGIVSDTVRCSGIAVAEGLIATAAERIAGAAEIEVHGVGGRARGEIGALDLATDVALIRADRVWGATIGPAVLTPRLATSALAVGRAREELLGSWGHLRRLGPAWHSRRGGRLERRIEVDARVPAGAEGGALVDAAGLWIGMTVFGPRGRVLAIPPETIARWVAEVHAHGRLRRAFLGLKVMAVPIRAEHWAAWGLRGAAALVIVDVVSDSPAERAGFEVGDLVLAIDGAPIEGTEVLQRSVQQHPVGSELRLTRRRGAALEQVVVTLAERAA
jgi:S1-C subfamily serine protease